MKRLRSGGQEPLCLSAGNLVNGVSRQAKIKFQILMEALRLMHYRAVALGMNDLYLGLEFLRAFPSRQGYPPLVCANFFDASGRRAFEPFVVVRGSARGAAVGVIGALSWRYALEVEQGGSGYRLAKPEDILPEVVRDVREAGAQKLVLIFHGTLEETKRLASKRPEFDLVVCAEGESDPLPEPEYVRAGGKRVPIVTAGSRGKHLVIVGVGGTGGRGANPGIYYRVVPLGPEFDDDAQMVQLLSLYEEMLRAERLIERRYRRPLPMAGGTVRTRYVGSDRCGQCHKEAFGVWRGSAHARAYETLVRRGHAYDPECVRCHVTGFEFETGFLTRERTPRLGHVGCESCHGPAGHHALGRGPKPQAKEARRACARCHNPDHSPRFEFEPYFRKIAH